jgi:hypothetical protein
MNKNLVLYAVLFLVLDVIPLLGGMSVMGSRIQTIAIDVGDDNHGYVSDAKVWLENANLEDPEKSYDPAIISAARGPFKTSILGSAFVYYKIGFCRSSSDEKFMIPLRGELHIETPFHEKFSQPLSEVFKMKEFDAKKNSIPGCHVQLKRKYSGKLPDVDLGAVYESPPYVKRLRYLPLKEIQLQETPALTAIDWILREIRLADPGTPKEVRDSYERWEPILEKPDPRQKHVKNLPHVTMHVSKYGYVEALDALDRVLTLAGVTYEITDSEVVVKTKDGVVLNKDRWVKDKKKSEQK